MTSFPNLRRTLLVYVIATLIVVTGTTILLQTRASNNSELSEFEAFFQKTIANGIDQPKYQPTRWGTPLYACIFGAVSPESHTRIRRIFSLIGTTTALQIEPTFVEEITACSPLTFLYVRMHSGRPELKFQIVGDVSFIMKKAGMTKPIDVKFSPFGMGLVMIEDGRPPQTYVSAYQFDQNETEYDVAMANNVIQQEIVQVLLAAPDYQTNSKPKSLIEEWKIQNIAENDLGAEPIYRKQFIKFNAPNICLYDVMLLKTLYSEESYRSDGTLAFYKAYIKKHFDMMQKSAAQSIEDPDYNLLFSGKC